MVLYFKFFDFFHLGLTPFDHFRSKTAAAGCVFAVQSHHRFYHVSYKIATGHEF